VAGMFCREAEASPVASEEDIMMLVGPVLGRRLVE